MESKFKEGLYRLTLLFAAVLIVILAATPQDTLSRIVLALCGLGLGATALAYSRLPALPDVASPMLLSLLLTVLLWHAPEEHAMWLWGWAAVIALPQPLLLLGLNVLLAATSWWQVTQFTAIEQDVLTGLLLVALVLLGLARHMGLLTLWRGVSSRTRLLENILLWSGSQLQSDLPLETTRCHREGSHGELLLLRCPSDDQPGLAEALTSTVRSYENCYQIDGNTLAALLAHRNAKEAMQRRELLLETLPSPFQARFITLAPALSLDSQLLALQHQERPVVVLKELD